MKQIPGLLALAVLVGAGGAGLVRADQLDNRLNEAMPAIVKQLKEKGYKNVGVLRFGVQQGDARESFSSPLSGNLPTRVENFLIIHGGPNVRQALGVIRDAGPTGGKQNISKLYSDSRERRKLFDLSYPLAWGKQKVKPDVFLCGKVQVSKDVRKTTLSLQYFDRKEPGKLVDLRTIEMKTDRDVLRDLGYSFGLSEKARVAMRGKRAPTSQADEALFEQLPRTSPQVGDKKDPDKKQPDKKQPDDKKVPDEKKPDEKVEITPASVGGVEVQMLVDGAAQEIREASSQGDPIKWQVASPAAGKAIAFRLKNNSARRVGVVLRLNGFSTVGQQTDEPERCRKWVINAGKTCLIKGFYMPSSVEETDKEKEKPAGDKTIKTQVLPFKVLVGDEEKVYRSANGDRVGLIELDVFEAGGGTQELMVNGKGLPRTKEEKAKESYVSLRSALIHAARMKAAEPAAGSLVAKRAVIVVDDKVAGVAGSLKRVTFENPQFVARIAIKVIARQVAPEE